MQIRETEITPTSSTPGVVKTAEECPAAVYFHMLRRFLILGHRLNQQIYYRVARRVPR
jgi:hypothetical protein